MSDDNWVFEPKRVGLHKWHLPDGAGLTCRYLKCSCGCWQYRAGRKTIRETVMPACRLALPSCRRMSYWTRAEELCLAGHRTFYPRLLQIMQMRCRNGNIGAGFWQFGIDALAQRASEPTAPKSPATMSGWHKSWKINRPDPRHPGRGQ